MKNKSLPQIWKVLGLIFILSGILLQIPFTIGTANAQSKTSQIELEDGEYTIQVDLEGGTGRSSITSPALLIVRNGAIYAQIEWSSSHYDYMLMENEKYLPVNKEGNSVFEIPVSVFDEPITVIADTTAMSVPHEIEYSLTFRQDTITSRGQTSMNTGWFVLLGAAVLVLACAAACFIVKRKRKP